LADENDAAQERGKVSNQGMPANSRDRNGLPTAADIGLCIQCVKSATPKKPRIALMGPHSGLVAEAYDMQQRQTVHRGEQLSQQ
jgi:hypothetical protein